MSYSRILSTICPRKSLPLAILFFSRFANAEDNKNDTSYIVGIGAMTTFLCFAVVLNEIWHIPYQQRAGVRGQRAAVRRQRTVAMEALVAQRGIAAAGTVNNRTPLETIHEDAPLGEQHFDRTQRP
jgi:hypothetical protein